MHRAHTFRVALKFGQFSGPRAAIGGGGGGCRVAAGTDAVVDGAVHAPDLHIGDQILEGPIRWDADANALDHLGPANRAVFVAAVQQSGDTFPTKGMSTRIQDHRGIIDFMADRAQEGLVDAAAIVA